VVRLSFFKKTKDMSKRFSIRSTRPAKQMIGSLTVFGTGEDVPFKQSLILGGERISEKEFEFQTGLEEKHIQNSIFFDDEEKQRYIKQLQEDVKVLQKAFGADRLKPTNAFFWGDDHGQKGNFAVNNETLSTFYDTKNEEHLLLYWKIMGGGYADAIGPTYQTALAFGLPLYMTELEEEAERQTEDIGLKGKAFAALEDVSNKKSAEDLLWLSWMLLDVNKGFTKKTPKASLYKAHFEFIEGSLVKSGKKLCAKQFLEAVDLLKKDKTKAIATAIAKAGEFLNLIYTNKENQLETRKSHTILGSTIEEAIETLLKPTHHEELEYLKSEVEDKLK
jgi:hypothetical protein